MSKARNNATVPVLNVALLRTTIGSSGDAIELLGYYTKGDGGGGTFYWDETSTEADNGGTIFAVSGIVTGRWKRSFSGAINVKWFGAKGDGTTDDTAAIQSAIDSITLIYDNESYPIVDNVVFIPSGKYSLSSGSTVILRKGVTVKGESRTSSILLHGGGEVPCIKTDDENTYNTNILLSDFSIEGTSTTTYGIYLKGAVRNNDIERVTISDCQINLFAEDSWTLYLSRCDFQSATVNNLKMLNPTAVTVIGCRIDGALEDCVYMSMSDTNASVHTVFINSYIQRATNNGVNAVDIDSISFTDCYFEGNNRADGSNADINWVRGTANRGINLNISGCYATATTGGNNNTFINADTSGQIGVVNTRNYNADTSDNRYSYGINVGYSIRSCTVVGSRIEATTSRINYSSNYGGNIIDTEKNLYRSDSNNVNNDSNTNLYFKKNSPSNRRLEDVLQAGGVDKWYIGRGDSDEAVPGDYYISRISGGSSNAEFRIDDTNGHVHVGKMLRIAQYTVATLPSPSISGGIIFVTDTSDGITPAFTDGTKWISMKTFLEVV